MQIQPEAPRHPVALFFHCAFKACAVTWYIICEWVSKDQFVANFVVCILLLALDFWTVKNVTGRLLVGLRWWNEANEGGSAWRFESLQEGQRVINPSERRLFWIVLVANPVLWALLALGSLFGLSWNYLIIAIIGIIMGTSNLIGYFKCSKDAKSQLQNMSTNIAANVMASRLNAAIARV